jgi:hypothetical protein
MKRQIRFVMKSGYAFTVLCENVKVKSIGNELTGYSYEGGTGSRPLYIRIENVDAVIEDGNVEE